MGWREVIELHEQARNSWLEASRQLQYCEEQSAIAARNLKESLAKCREANNMITKESDN